MKPCFLVLLFLILSKSFAFTDLANNEILYLEQPYTITHLSHLNLDCVWTRTKGGALQSEALGPDGSGACWDASSVALANKLDKEKKLVWHNPPVFDYEYGDKDKCYYRVDKANGLVQLLFGNISESEANECRLISNKNKALQLATKVRKVVSFGGYTATQDNILGSVLLACYTGSIDSDSTLVSPQERIQRYKALLSLYEGDPEYLRRINHAFSFAELNLRDRYPLDTRGQYRASVCEQMIYKGKL